jgi:Zn-dependent protease
VLKAFRAKTIDLALVPPLPEGTPSGWYADPTGAEKARYWDSVGWTQNTRRDVAVLTAPTLDELRARAAAPLTPPAASPPPVERHHGPVRRALGAVGAAILAAVKWGALVLSKVKFATVLVSMLVSIAAYSLLWGWKFAVGFVLVLLIHEYGHVVQLRREGVRASAPLFIPFLGAVVAMREMPRDAFAEAKVGLAGPIAGTAASLAVLATYWITGAVFWQALAYTGFLLQLFNLAPVLPLDGGRAMAAVSTKLWLLGWLGMIAAAVIVSVDISFQRAFILYLIALMGGRELLRRWRARRTPASQTYHRVALRDRLRIALTYVVLLLGTGTATVSLYVHETINDASHHTVTQK